MTLHELLETVVQRGLLKASRTPPMRTAVKQYAAILGMDAIHCPPEVYHLSSPQLTTLIDAKAPANLGSSAVRNLKNNVRWLLRQGEALRILDTLGQPEHSWREARRISWKWFPKRGHMPITGADYVYALRPLPPGLATEFQEFSTWSTAPFVPERPARMHKRQKTMLMYEATVSGIAGFAHRIEGMPVETMTLQILTEPKLVTRFTAWWIARRGKVTSSIQHYLAGLCVIACYWLKDEPRAAALRKIMAQLSHPEAVYDKRTGWLSLKELEAAGLSQYPLNARRLQENKLAAKIATRMRRGQPVRTRASANRHLTALWVSHSLMLRLLVRIPLRQRNLREMQLDRNLRRVDSKWQLTFKGDELKIGWRDGRQHQITYAFPEDLVELLEEWLTIWRPLLLKDADTKEVFINTSGNPHPEGKCRRIIQVVTWKFTGVAINPHTIRDIWATEYLKSTRDAAGAAYMLGNTVAIVMKHYAHLLDAECEQRATTWLQSRLT